MDTAITAGTEKPKRPTRKSKSAACRKDGAYANAVLFLNIPDKRFDTAGRWISIPGCFLWYTQSEKATQAGCLGGFFGVRHYMDCFTVLSQGLFCNLIVDRFCLLC